MSLRAFRAARVGGALACLLAVGAIGACWSSSSGGGGATFDDDGGGVDARVDSTSGDSGNAMDSSPGQDSSGGGDSSSGTDATVDAAQADAPYMFDGFAHADGY